MKLKMKILLGTGSVAALITAVGVGAGVAVQQKTATATTQATDVENSDLKSSDQENQSSKPSEDHQEQDSYPNQPDNSKPNSNDNNVVDDSNQTVVDDKTLITDDIHYLAFGDSIAAGFNSKLKQDYQGELTTENGVQKITGLSYPSFVAQFIDEIQDNRLASYKNFSLTSTTIKQWNDLFSDPDKSGLRLFWKDDFDKNRQDFMNRLKQANLLTVSLGANDFIDLLLKRVDIGLLVSKLTNPNATTSEIIGYATSLLASVANEISQRFIELDRNIRSVNENVTINFVTYPMPLLRLSRLIDDLTSGIQLGSNKLSDFLLNFVNNLPVITTTIDNNAQLINVYNKDVWQADSNFLADSIFDIHPTEHGYKKMAQEVFLKLAIDRRANNSNLETLNPEWTSSYVNSDLTLVSRKIVFEDSSASQIASLILGVNNQRDLTSEERIQEFEPLFDIANFGSRVTEILTDRAYLRFGIEFLQTNKAFQSSPEIQRFANYLLENDAQNFSDLLDPIIHSNFFQSLLLDVQHDVDSQTLDTSTPISLDLILKSLLKEITKQDRFVNLIKSLLTSPVLQDPQKLAEFKEAILPLMQSLLDNSSVKTLFSSILGSIITDPTLKNALGGILQKVDIGQSVSTLVGSIMDDLSQNASLYSQSNSLSEIIFTFLDNNSLGFANFLQNITTQMFTKAPEETKALVNYGLDLVSQQLGFNFSAVEKETLNEFLLENLKSFNDLNVLKSVFQILVKALKPDSSSGQIIDLDFSNIFNKLSTNDLLGLFKNILNTPYMADATNRVNYKRLLLASYSIIIKQDNFQLPVSSILNSLFNLNLDSANQNLLDSFFTEIAKSPATLAFLSGVVDIVFDHRDEIIQSSDFASLAAPLLKNGKEGIVAYLKFVLKQIDVGPVKDVLVQTLSDQLIPWITSDLINLNNATKDAFEGIINDSINLLANSTTLDTFYDSIVESFTQGTSALENILKIISLPSIDDFTQKGINALLPFFDILKRTGLSEFLSRPSVIKNFKIIVNNLLVKPFIKGTLEKVDIPGFSQEDNTIFRVILNSTLDNSRIIDHANDLLKNLLDNVSGVLNATDLREGLQLAYASIQGDLSNILKDIAKTIFSDSQKENTSRLLRSMLIKINATTQLGFSREFINALVSLIANNATTILSDQNIDGLLASVPDLINSTGSLNLENIFNQVIQHLVPNYDSSKPLTANIDAIFNFAKPILRDFALGVNKDLNRRDLKVLLKGVFNSSFVPGIVTNLVPFETTPEQKGVIEKLVASVLKLPETEVLANRLVDDFFNNADTYINTPSFNAFVSLFLRNNKDTLTVALKGIINKLVAQHNSDFQNVVSILTAILSQQFSISLDANDLEIMSEFLVETVHNVSNSSLFGKVISFAIDTFLPGSPDAPKVSFTEDDIFQLAKEILEHSNFLNDPIKRRQIFRTVSRVIKQLLQNNSAQTLAKNFISSFVDPSGLFTEDLNQVIDFAFSLPTLGTLIDNLLDAVDTNFDYIKNSNSLSEMITKVISSSSQDILSFIQSVLENSDLVSISEPLGNILSNMLLSQISFASPALEAQFKSALKNFVNKTIPVASKIGPVSQLIELVINNISDFSKITIEEIRKYFPTEQSGTLNVLWSVARSFINDPAVKGLLNDQQFIGDFALLVQSLIKDPNIQTILFSQLNFGPQFSSFESQLHDVLKLVMDNFDFGQAINIFVHEATTTETFSNPSLLASLLTFVTNNKDSLINLFDKFISQSQLFKSASFKELVAAILPQALDSLGVTLSEADARSIVNDIINLADKIYDKNILTELFNVALQIASPLATNPNLSIADLLAQFAQNLQPFNLIKEVLSSISKLSPSDKTSVRLSVDNIFKIVSKEEILAPLLNKILPTNIISNDSDRAQLRGLIREINFDNYLSNFMTHLSAEIINNSDQYSQATDMSSLINIFLRRNKSELNTFAKRLFATLAQSHNNKFVIDFALTEFVKIASSQGLTLTTPIVRELRKLVPDILRITANSDLVTRLITLIQDANLKEFNFQSIISAVTTNQGLLVLIKAISASPLLNDASFIQGFKENFFNLLKVVAKDKNLLSDFFINMLGGSNDVDRNALNRIVSKIVDSKEVKNLFNIVFDSLFTNGQRRFIANSNSFNELILNLIRKVANSDDTVNIKRAIKELTRFVLTLNTSDFNELIKFITAPFVSSLGLGITTDDADRYVPFFSTVLQTLPKSNKILDLVVDGIFEGLKRVDTIGPNTFGQISSGVIDLIKTLVFSSTNQIQLSKTFDLLPTIKTFVHAPGFGKGLADLLNLLFDKSDFSKKTGIYKIVIDNVLPAYARNHFIPPTSNQGGGTSDGNGGSQNSISLDIGDGITSSAIFKVNKFIYDISRTFSEAFLDALVEEAETNPAANLHESAVYKGMFRFNALLHMFLRTNLPDVRFYWNSIPIFSNLANIGPNLIDGVRDAVYALFGDPNNRPGVTQNQLRNLSQDVRRRYDFMNNGLDFTTNMLGKDHGFGSASQKQFANGELLSTVYYAFENNTLAKDINGNYYLVDNYMQWLKDGYPTKTP